MAKSKEHMNLATEIICDMKSHMVESHKTIGETLMELELMDARMEQARKATEKSLMKLDRLKAKLDAAGEILDKWYTGEKEWLKNIGAEDDEDGRED